MKSLALALAFLPSLAFADLEVEKELRAIEFLESTNGQFVKHKLVSSGINKGTRAGGNFGLMPLTVKELVEKNQYLLKKYKYVLYMNNDEITAFLINNPEADKDIARFFWKKLRKRFDSTRSAFSWFHGPNAGARATVEQVEGSEYVKKFKTYMNTQKQELAANP